MANLWDVSNQLSVATASHRIYAASSSTDYYILGDAIAQTGAANTFTAGQTIDMPSGSADLNMEAENGNGLNFRFQRGGGSVRWNLNVPATAEGGGDTESDLRIMSYTDAGSYKSTVLQMKRSTGRVGINNANPGAQLDIKANSASTKGLIVNAYTGATAVAQEWQYNGTASAQMQATSSAAGLIMQVRNLGAANAGPYIYIKANSGGSGAAGYIRMQELDAATSRMLWVDAAHQLRIHSAAPTSDSTASDTYGSVVGLQTSNEVYKNLLGPGATATEALNYIRDAVATIQRFTYKSGAYDQEFDGIVVHNGAGLQRYGMDADADHDGGKSLNVINAISDLMRVVADQAARIEQLEAQLQGA